jgi:hypothetical protein
MFFQNQPSARCAQKTVTFHLDFGSEIVQNARHEMLVLHSMENSELANLALGRVKGKEVKDDISQQSPFGVLSQSYNKRFKSWYIYCGINFIPVYQIYTSQNNSLYRCRAEETDWNVCIMGNQTGQRIVPGFSITMLRRMFSLIADHMA